MRRTSARAAARTLCTPTRAACCAFGRRGAVKPSTRGAMGLWRGARQAPRNDCHHHLRVNSTRGKSLLHKTFHVQVRVGGGLRRGRAGGDAAVPHAARAEPRPAGAVPPPAGRHVRRPAGPEDGGGRVSVAVQKPALELLQPLAARTGRQPAGRRAHESR